ncbi:MAG: glycoside hydrolase family 2 TIM barrel-domain containing protein [Calditrichaceae bacterium]
MQNIKLILMTFIVVFMPAFLAATEQTNHLHYLNWGKSAAYLSNGRIVPLYRQDNWQIQSPTGEWTSLSLPFYSSSTDQIKLRCDFNVAFDAGNSEIFLKSNGIKGSGQFILNGKIIHNQINNSAPFSVKIPSDILNKGVKNQLIITLSGSATPEFGFPSFVNIFDEPGLTGIVRPLYLSVESKNRISNANVKVKTFKPAVGFGYSYQVNLFLTNESDLKAFNAKRFQVDEQIFSPSGVKLFQRRTGLDPEKQLIQGDAQVPDEYLWSPQNPKKLSMIISVKNGYDTIIEDTLRFGLRSVQIQENNFFLNNQPVVIKGVSYYENLESLKSKDYFGTLVSDLSKIKSLQFNAVRFPHYLPDFTAIHIADSLGLLVFAEIPIWRYPLPLYQNDYLLETSKSTIQSLGLYSTESPSLVALGIGQEIPVHESAAQKFMLILSGSVRTKMDVLSYISPISGYPLPPENAADFYMYDTYKSILNGSSGNERLNFPYLYAGKIGIDLSNRTESDKNGTDPIKNYGLISGEIQMAMNQLGLKGGFLDSFVDWKSGFPNHNTINNPDHLVIRTGMLTYDRKAKTWINKSAGNIWDSEHINLLPEKPVTKKTNFFSLITFIATVLFLLIYRQRVRLRENLKRSLRHPYGFFVDMRERRIIPLYSSFLVGAYSSVLLSVFVSSVINYYHGSYTFQEAASHLLGPLDLYETFLKMSISPGKTVLVFFLIFYSYPFIISVLLRVFSFFSAEKMRFRQGVAIGFWSGAPFIFLLPLSLAMYQLLSAGGLRTYMIYLFLFFILWAHARIINGIQVLFRARTSIILMLLLLSYCVPFLIFWILFKPEPYLYEYLKLIFNAQNLL